jgi:hypothetical protein
MGRKVSNLLRVLANDQQWYRRRKLDAVCYVGHKFEDPEEHEESCDCVAEDYEWCVPPREKADVLVTLTLFDKMVNVYQLVLSLYRLVHARRIMTSTLVLPDIGRFLEMGVSRESSLMKRS